MEAGGGGDGRQSEKSFVHETTAKRAVEANTCYARNKSPCHVLGIGEERLGAPGVSMPLAMWPRVRVRVPANVSVLPTGSWRRGRTKRQHQAELNTLKALSLDPHTKQVQRSWSRLSHDTCPTEQKEGGAEVEVRQVEGHTVHSCHTTRQKS